MLKITTRLVSTSSRIRALICPCSVSTGGMIRLEQSQTDYYLGKWLTKFVPNSSDSNWSDTERKQAQVNKTRLRAEQTTNVHALFPAQIFTCHLPRGLYTSSLPVCIYKPREPGNARAAPALLNQAGR